MHDHHSSQSGVLFNFGGLGKGYSFYFSNDYIQLLYLRVLHILNDRLLMLALLFMWIASLACLLHLFFWVEFILLLLFVLKEFILRLLSII